MTKRYLPQEILDYLRKQAAQDRPPCSPEEIAAHVSASRATVNRYLLKMRENGDLMRIGAGPAIRYSLPVATATPPAVGQVHQPLSASTYQGFHFSEIAAPLVLALQAPIGTRRPVSYQRSFVENYLPNQTSLLPPDLAATLLTRGKASGQQPAGTYARKVLEQLLIDLAWHSSRLEGNRKSLLDTEVLFARGRAQGDDLDSIMLLNHKEAIEFIVDAVPEYGIQEDVVRNIQALLMQGLLANPDAAGGIRHTLVNITDSVYLPVQIPQLLETMLQLIIDKAQQIKNPVEAAFFLWVNVAYLQPFEDGNKRTSRLCANLPLLLQNCAPLSFLDVEAADYALAVLAVYERQDVSLAVELFAWTYLRSIAKYEVILQSMSAPDPFRSRYREQLGEAVRQVVGERRPPDKAVTSLAIAAPDRAAFQEMLQEDLRHLESYNCARYRLSMPLTADWIRQGRPGLLIHKAARKRTK